MEIRNQLTVCPFDHNHVVKKGRLQQHLVKCRQNHLHEEFKVCPFNACHRLHPVEFQMHLNECPDKECLEREIYNRAKEKSGKFKTGNLTVPIFNNEPPPCTEDWDQEDDLQEEAKEKSYAVTPPQEPAEAYEELPPLQPRILHTAIVSAMKKQNHERKGLLRIPKNLPKALGQHWPKQNPLPQNCENPVQEDQQAPLSTDTTHAPEPPHTTSTIPTQTDICIERSSQTTGSTLLSELTSICNSIKPLSPKRPDWALTATSSTQALPSQESTPNKSVALECTATDELKSTQKAVEDVGPLAPISPLSEKMRSLGRGMLFKFQVHNSQLNGPGRSVPAGSEQTTNSQPGTDSAGSEKLQDGHRQLAENSMGRPTSSDTCRASIECETKNEHSYTGLQPVAAHNAVCARPDTRPLGCGRGILALKYNRERNKNQEPSVGKRAATSPLLRPQRDPLSRYSNTPGAESEIILNP